LDGAGRSKAASKGSIEVVATLVRVNPASLAGALVDATRTPLIQAMNPSSTTVRSCKLARAVGSGTLKDFRR